MHELNLSDEQIASLYRMAKDKKYEITILAQLNAVSKAQIIDKLKALGCNVEFKEIKRAGRKPGDKPGNYWTTEEEAQLIKLVQQGLSHKEIGVIMNRTRGAIMTRAAIIRRREGFNFW
jgi:DNA-binding NarL/FixJ family response regulator